MNVHTKTISVHVARHDYPYTGTEYRTAVDKLFLAMWSRLSPKDQKALWKTYRKEIDMIDLSKKKESES